MSKYDIGFSFIDHDGFVYKIVEKRNDYYKATRVADGNTNFIMIERFYSEQYIDDCLSEQ